MRLVGVIIITNFCYVQPAAATASYELYTEASRLRGINQVYVRVREGAHSTITLNEGTISATRSAFSRHHRPLLRKACK
jgi:hypothetical protein